MQRESAVSRRCSDVHASSVGSTAPPSELVATPSRSSETSKLRILAFVPTERAYTVRTVAYVHHMEPRLRPLSEEECYLRCYGWRGSDDTVKIVAAGQPLESESPSALTERIRIAFEARLEAREPEAA
jgi:hypothetical protein